MIYCSNCGAKNNKRDLFCCQCGADLPRISGSFGNSSNKKLIAFISLGLVILSSIIFFAFSFFSPKMRLGKAFVNAAADFTSNVDGDILEAASFVKKKISKGDYSAEVYFSIDNIGSIKNDYSISRKHKLSSGTVSLALDNVDELNFDYSVDRKAVQFKLKDSIFNVYGFKFKDYNESSIVSYISKSIPLTDNISFDTFDFAKHLQTYTQDNYKSIKELLEPIETESMGKRSLNLNGTLEDFDIYRVSWNVNKFNSKLAASGKNVTSQEFFCLLSKLFTSLEPSINCYLKEGGQLACIDVVFMGRQFLFALDGQINPWDKFSIKENISGNLVTLYEGYMVKDSSVFSIFLGDNHSDFFSAVYDKRTKLFSISCAPTGVLASGTFICDDGNIWFSASLLPKYYDDLNIELNIYDLRAQPTMLSEKFIDVSHIGLADIQRILLDFGLIFL